MNQQKIEDLFLLSLEASEQDRAKSVSLSTGYTSQSNTWEILFRYNGEIEDSLQNITTEYTLLGSGFASAVVTEEQLARLSEIPGIIYIEKPKSFYFSVNNGKSASCLSVQETSNLTGRGVLVGIIDSAVDYTHPAFKQEDGSSRIVYYWDQNSKVYTKEELDGDVNIQSLIAGSGHGTAVAGIAAGNGAGSPNNIYRGVAYESLLIVVKLRNITETGFPGTRQIMEGVNFILEKAVEMNMPVAINLSFGNNYGSHSGNSLLENFLDEKALQWKSVIVVASGNEGVSGHHIALDIKREKTYELRVAENERSLTLSIWKEYPDVFFIQLIAPDGTVAQIDTNQNGKVEFNLMDSKILGYVGEPVPYNARQEVIIEWIPVEGKIRINEGIWKIRIIPQNVKNGIANMWIPSAAITGVGTRFLQASVETTLTIPSTAANVITVGAYNSYTNTYAPFSGRGYTVTNQIKPDIVAPGVDIMTAAPFGRYTRQTGTSMAAPFVTGSAALLMEWGIVNGNDLYLYGEKVKAYLTRGAKVLQNEAVPNKTQGYGALCFRDSF